MLRRHPVSKRGKNVTRKQFAYVEGNTVRRLETAPRRLEEETKKQISHRTRKNREKAAHMNPGYVLFLSMAILVTGIVCIQYLQIQSDITNRLENIASLESQFNALKTGNDEEYNRILGTVDLEEVKRVAMEELGMTYAKDGQVIVFQSEESDFVRQYIDIE